MFGIVVSILSQKKTPGGFAARGLIAYCQTHSGKQNSLPAEESYFIW